MTEGSSASKQENERQYLVIDQMVTMHSLLRDHLERRAFWLNTTLIALSLFLTVFSFIGDDVLHALGFDPPTARLLLGAVAVAVLLCSITEFRVDWRSIAGKHADAASRLGVLKATYRKSFAETGGNDISKNVALTGEYEKVMSNLPPIPDRWFGTLKAEHRFKRMLSERISQHPTAPIWFLQMQLRLRGIRESLQRTRG